jgi:hypothetical protein
MILVAQIIFGAPRSALEEFYEALGVVKGIAGVVGAHHETVGASVWDPFNGCAPGQCCNEARGIDELE